MMVLSKELAAIAQDFGSERELSISERQDTATYLAALARLAANMELELVLFRDMEAGRQMRTVLNDEATANLSDMLQEGENKVVRYDFGRKP